MIQSVQERTRGQLDRREPRDAFWFNKVAPVFNIVSREFSYEFCGVLHGLVPGCKEGIERLGEELKKEYMGIRSAFTVAYDKWSVSGQNNPDNFEEFCEANSMTKELSACGKKCLILFSVLGCGRENQMQDLLDVAIRTIPAEAMGDSGEKGVDREIVEVTPRKRRRDTSDEMREGLNAFRKLCERQEEVQKSSKELELLQRMKEILQMRRELRDDEVDERELLNDKLDKVKDELRKT